MSLHQIAQDESVPAERAAIRSSASRSTGPTSSSSSASAASWRTRTATSLCSSPMTRAPIRGSEPSWTSWSRAGTLEHEVYYLRQERNLGFVGNCQPRLRSGRPSRPSPAEQRLHGRRRSGLTASAMPRTPTAASPRRAHSRTTGPSSRFLSETILAPRSRRTGSSSVRPPRSGRARCGSVRRFRPRSGTVSTSAARHSTSSARSTKRSHPVTARRWTSLSAACCGA